MIVTSTGPFVSLVYRSRNANCRLAEVAGDVGVGEREGEGEGELSACAPLPSGLAQTCDELLPTLPLTAPLVHHNHVAVSNDGPHGQHDDFIAQIEGLVRSGGYTSLRPTPALKCVKRALSR